MTMLVPEYETSAHRINDKAAVSGGLLLVPARLPLEVLTDGMRLDTGDFFEHLLEQCADIEARANGSKEDDGNASNRAPPGSARRPSCSGQPDSAPPAINGFPGIDGPGSAL